MSEVVQKRVLVSEAMMGVLVEVLVVECKTVVERVPMVENMVGSVVGCLKESVV